MKSSTAKSNPAPVAGRLLKLGLALVGVVAAAVAICVIIDQVRIWREERANAAAMAERTANSFTLENPPSPDNFSPVQVVTRSPGLLDQPARAADDPLLDLEDDEQILGLVRHNEARAYSLNILTGPEREIINDVLGGEPVMATWCHLCNSALGFSRSVGGRPLHFEVSGLLWEGNLVMVDVETGSLWSQLLGEAMRGELTGQRLEVLPSLLTTWGEWKRLYPHTTAIAIPRAVNMFRRGGLYPTGFCLALTVNGFSRAWDFSDLDRQLAICDVVAEVPVLITFDLESMTAAAFDRRVQDRVLEFVVREGRVCELETGSVFQRLSGRCDEGPLAGTALRPLPAYVSDPATWSLYHPSGTIWRAPEVAESVP